MNNGRQLVDAAHDGVLHWRKPVLASEDLRRNLNGQRRLIVGRAAVITPLAAEELRAGDVEIVRETPEQPAADRATWGCAQDRLYPLVRSALQALAREAVPVRELPGADEKLPCRWAKALAECIARGECCGGVVFCQDPGLVCCVVNKLPGLRGAAVATVSQAARATLSLGANLLAVEMPGRTFFEVRQILRNVCAAGRRSCPEGLACTLRELDGHAHR
jgi:ribose 5-phosphate isomerase RpiB